MEVLVRLEYIVLLKTLLIACICALRRTTFSDYTAIASTCSGTDILFEDTDRSLISCSVRCSENQECVGAFHTDSTGACIGCRKYFTSGVSLSPPDAGTLYFMNDCKQVISSSWDYFEGSYYQLFQTTKNYVEAKAHCEKQCGNLVHIDTSNEVDYIETMVTNFGDTAYIGLVLDSSTNQWTWIDDGAPLTISDWYMDEPNGRGTEECVALSRSRNFKWVDLVCDASLPFICERK